MPKSTTKSQPVINEPKKGRMQDYSDDDLMEAGDHDGAETRSQANSSKSGVENTMVTNALLQEQEVLDAIFKGIPMGVILIDSKGTIAAFSTWAEMMFLCKSSDVIGQNVNALMPPSIKIRHDFYLSRARGRMETGMSLAYAKYSSTKETTFQAGDASKVMTLNDLAYANSEVLNFAASWIAKQTLFGGTGRELAALDKTGRTFPFEARVFSILCRAQLYYLGFTTDLRGVSEFQMLTVKQEKLLGSLLDDRTLARVMKDEKKIYDHFDSASVLFADICQFGEKTAALDREIIVEFLGEIFTLFDKTIASSPGVEKVKTIGDCYMACSGAPKRTEDHGFLLTKAALELLKAVGLYNHRIASGTSVSTLMYSRAEIKTLGSTVDLQFKGKNGQTINWRDSISPIAIRIGLHSGPVTGGVMSRIRGFFDIIGNTVNYAQALENAAPPNHVQLSQDSFKLLPEDLQQECELRGGVELKGIGRVQTYLLK